MWSRPLLRRFRQSVEIPQTQVSQGFTAFRPDPSRIPPRHSQIKRDTNFATPGYSLSCHDTTARGKNKVFSVCGHLCGQDHFCAVFGNRWKSRKHRCHKALRRFALTRPGYRHGTPKAGALPTALHPEIFIFICAAIRCALLCLPGLRFPKKFSRYSPARFFRPLSVLRLAFSATGGARQCTPKQARYQLRSPPKYLFLLALQSAAPCFARPACGSRKKSSRYSPARFFRPLSVRYDNFNSIIDFLPEVNG